MDNVTKGTMIARTNNPIPTINCVLSSDKPPVSMKYNPATASIVGMISEYNNKNSIMFISLVRNIFPLF